MSLQYCSITGEPLQEAVVSKKSGHIFEKRIIEKQIQATGQCPITDLPLDISDLIPLKINESIKPRPANATSIPSIVNNLQNEWDTVMLETYNLKQHLETVRQELSHALYQHDAACRVIARVVKERDEARKELSELYSKLGISQGQDNGMVIEQSNGLGADICQQVEESALKLNKQRKKNKKDQEYLKSFQDVNTVSQFSPVDSLTLHSTTKPGITCVKIHPEKEIIGTGGVDGSVILYDKANQKILHQFEGHKKQVNDIIFANFDEKIRIFSAGQDGQVLGFSYDLETKESNQVYQHKCAQAATSIDVLPINFVVASSCLDGTFTYHDARENKELATIKEYQNTLAFHSIRIHPDGHFAALGASDGSIIIWNIFENSLVAQLSDEGKGEVDTLGFSENGYILASGSKKENAVKIWDLRKSNCVKVFPDIGNVEYVCFDFSAQILSILSDKYIKLYSSKNYELLSTTEAHKENATAIGWGPKTKYYVSVSQDRHLTIHSNQ